MNTDIGQDLIRGHKKIAKSLRHLKGNVNREQKIMLRNLAGSLCKLRF